MKNLFAMITAVIVIAFIGSAMCATGYKNKSGNLEYEKSYKLNDSMQVKPTTYTLSRFTSFHMFYSLDKNYKPDWNIEIIGGDTIISGDKDKAIKYLFKKMCFANKNIWQTEKSPTANNYIIKKSIKTR